MKTTIRFAADDAVGASEILRNGGLLAVPTETVYGLAADSFNGAAVERIYEAKGRPENKPISVLLTGMDMVEQVACDIPPIAYRLARKFWPGPLTMVLKSRGTLPKVVTAGGDTIGVRVPDHAATLAVIEALGHPLAAPSANLSGAASPKNAQAVIDALDGKIDAVLDGGACSVGIESTIVDVTDGELKILRQGGLLEEAIRARNAMTVIGITGGTGSGKTTALRGLQAFHSLVIDADRVYHDLTMRSQGLKHDLEARFGAVYENGILNRKKLGTIVFSDQAALSDLNEITYKYVDEAVAALLEKAACDGVEVAAIDAIELIGNPLGARCDFLVAITAPIEVRVKRIMARENIAEEYARMRIAAQKDETFFNKNCDYVLKNEATDTAELFAKRAEALFRKLILS
ncbi:MAG: L-threonylcarbamoyladenylate synthase [Evtepia sp.]